MVLEVRQDYVPWKILRNSSRHFAPSLPHPILGFLLAAETSGRDEWKGACDTLSVSIFSILSTWTL